MDTNKTKEIRIYKINIKSCSGTASKNSKQYSVGLPTKWMRAMGITPDSRSVEITFDGREIKIRKKDDSNCDKIP